MAEKFFEYKGRPLVRSGNTIYYGDMNDAYVVCLTIKNAEEYKDITLAGDITIQLLATDESLSPKDRIVKKSVFSQPLTSELLGLSVSSKKMLNVHKEPIITSVLFYFKKRLML